MSISLVAYRQTYSHDDKGRHVVTMTRVVDVGLPYEAQEQLGEFFSDVYENDTFEIDYDVANESGHEWEFNGNVLLALLKHLKDTTGVVIEPNEDSDVDINNTVYHVETY